MYMLISFLLFASLSNIDIDSNTCVDFNNYYYCNEVLEDDDLLYLWQEEQAYQEFQEYCKSENALCKFNP